MKSSGASVLVVAEEGPLRDAVQALLTAIPELEQIHYAPEAQSALRIIEADRPDLVVVIADVLRGDLATFFERAKATRSERKWVVLAKDPRQQDEAESAGFDIVLPIGTPAAELAETIQELTDRILNRAEDHAAC